jgi:hypothetical protein
MLQGRTLISSNGHNPSRGRKAANRWRRVLYEYNGLNNKQDENC